MLLEIIAHYESNLDGFATLQRFLEDLTPTLGSQMLDPTEIVNKIILTPKHGLCIFHTKATYIKNNLSTANFSCPPHKLL